jgi:hypothetical protein
MDEYSIDFSSIAQADTQHQAQGQHKQLFHEDLFCLMRIESIKKATYHKGDVALYAFKRIQKYNYAFLAAAFFAC